MRRYFVSFLCSISLLSCLLFVSPSTNGADSANGAGPATDKLPAAAKRGIDFVKDIQPIFQKSCYSCHGSEEQEGGLRLDQKKRALEGGDAGAAILPGKAGESRLLHLIAGIDEEAGLMPPEGEGTKLTDEQIGVVRAWIEQGAIWPEGADQANKALSHWSYQPIINHPLPQVSDSTWVQNPIDAFILAKLDAQKVTPSPQAGRETLLRRVSLDLIGLPPRPEEVALFLEDQRPGAYSRAVERLLASPHYGERWGRHWLDLARYADSDGYEKDRARPFAWRYRSWVIDAFNADMPYDQFSIEQIAGDMLSEPSQSQRIASGFHRNTLHNTEGGTDKEEDRVKKTVDRTNTIGTIWLGLTVGCCQCHTHKYDPFTQREYFSMYAFLNSIDESDIDAPLPTEIVRYQAAKKAFDEKQAKLKSVLADYEKNKLSAAQAEWIKTAAVNPVVWKTLDPAIAKSAHGAKLDKQKDLSIIVTGTNQVSDVYTIEATTNLTKVTAIRLEVLPDKSLVKNGPGRANNGNFVLTTFRAKASPANGKGEPVELVFSAARADYSQKEWEPAKALNDDPKDGWAVGPEFGKRHTAVFETKSDVSFAGGVKLTIILDQTYHADPHNLGHFRLSASSANHPVSLEGVPEAVSKALATAADKRSADQKKELDKYHRTVDAKYVALKTALDAHNAKPPKPEYTKAQAVAQRGEIRTTKIHIRGDFLTKGAEVQPDSFDILPPLKARGEKPDRLDFAHWLVSNKNPLTSRVTVNRIWQQFFDRGLVLTGDDFGSQGEAPSHPQLLDWLALELQKGGWSLKQLHRLIVTSSVYQQSSATRTDLEVIDPSNILLARQVRKRVEAEIVRDLTLSASGLLDTKLGGPSVRPPQSSEYSKLTYAGSARWQVSKDGDAYRRGMYTFFQRTSPYPMLMTFDSPDSNACAARRSLSNTPLQSLTIWNDPVFFEAAQAFARRLMKESPDSGDEKQTVTHRIELAYQICMGRQPSPDEISTVIELYQAQLQLIASDKEAAAKITGEKPMPEKADITQLAAWVIVARTLINLDEFITRE